MIWDLNWNFQVSCFISPLKTINYESKGIEMLNILWMFYKIVVNTHMHADHITGTGLLKNLLPGSKSLISKASQAMADVTVEHGDVIEFGNHKLDVRATPGHTNGIKTLKIVMQFLNSHQLCFYPERLCYLCLPQTRNGLYWRYYSSTRMRAYWFPRGKRWNFVWFRNHPNIFFAW